jgi:hypothetical protein
MAIWSLYADRDCDIIVSLQVLVYPLSRIGIE